jgi:hypothetical protein
MKHFIINLLKNILLIIISSILFLSLLELSVRLFVDRINWYNPSLIDFLIPDIELGWKYKKNLNIEWLPEGSAQFNYPPAHFITNSIGLMESTYKFDDSHKSIVVLLIGSSENQYWK